MSKLECKDLRVSYFGYDDSICGFSAEFSDGFNVIFGGEKGGKTTLLKALAGIITSKGDIFLDGHDIRFMPQKDRNFAFVFDDYGLFNRRSVMYNLIYPFRLRKYPKDLCCEMAHKAAALFDLEVMIEAPVYKLTEWHKVALALCRAFMRGADVTFIDNVFARLDINTRREAFRRFMPLLSSNGIIVYATDSAEEAAFLSNDIYYLNYGYLLQKGSISDFRDKPSCASAFMTFRENASLLTGKITENGVEVAGAVVPFDLSRLIGDNYIGKEVLVGVRPQDFEMVSDGVKGEVLGRFFSHEGYLYYWLIDNETPVYIFSDNKLEVNAEFCFRVKNVFSLFDIGNERSVLRY